MTRSRRSSRKPALRVERQRQAEVGVERALVELVEQNGRDAVERGIVEDHAREHALGDHFDARRSETRLCRRTRRPTVSPTVSPSVAAMRCAAARAARRRGSSSRILPPPQLLVHQRERNPRRLAGAGRRDQHGARPAAQRRGQGLEDLVDGQSVGESAHGGRGPP